MHQHSDVVAFSQPFPFLHIGVKRSFLATLGRQDPYPLGHRFLERGYTNSDFREYLRVHQLTSSEVEGLAHDMAGYSGHWTPELLDLAERIGGGPWIDVHTRTLDLLSDELGGRDAHVRASKEILCEEYATAALQAGHRVLFVLRDPRAMLTSLTTWQGITYGGAPRPTLFHVRNWRKSVAYALAHEDDPNALWIRYEDLLEARSATLARMAAWLEIDMESEWGRRPLLDQHGEPWISNSSFPQAGHGIEEQQNRYRRLLDPATRRYIETLALPEMLALGYELEEVDDFSDAALHGFSEPWAVQRPEFPSNYSTATEELANETERWHLLSGPLDPSDEEAWFVSEGVRASLTAAVRSPR